ncbi:MAG TPA: DUF896 domain-containing protein [Desulfobacteria bacterium]|nr:DUF896 domain-containing protein [Desulfobacteria bacterium]
MITKELIERINFLARKSRADGLSAEEKAEQAQLRQEYLSAIRMRVRDTLDNVKVVDPADADSEAKN